MPETAVKMNKKIRGTTLSTVVPKLSIIKVSSGICKLLVFRVEAESHLLGVGKSLHLLCGIIMVEKENKAGRKKGLQ